METPRLHLITDDEVLADPGFTELARAVLEAGREGVALHLRGRRQSGRRLFELGRDLLGSAVRTGAMLVVNDRVDVAGALGVPAVQLGRRSLPVADARRILDAGTAVGASVHGPREAAEAAGADWLVAGTVFATPSHPGRAGAGVGLLASIRTVTELPVVAIGGITPEQVAPVCAAGAYGVAVLSGVWGASDPARATARYLERLAAAARPLAAELEARQDA